MLMMCVRPCVCHGRPRSRTQDARVYTFPREDTAGNSYTGTGIYGIRYIWRAKPDLLRAKPDQTTVPLASAFIVFLWI